MTGLHEIETAARRLADVAHRTPVLSSRTLDERVGASVALKAECFQRVGAFKFRGAYNAVAALTDDERRRGVFTYSSGNHGQAVALAGRLTGTATTVLMPTDAPPNKLAATRGYGAEVLTYDRYQQDRSALADDFAAERGAVLVPPYDHPDVIAGQGTVALEMLDQGVAPDVLMVPVGGGGLISGCALAVAARSPGTRIVGVEPETRRVGRDALASGHPVSAPIARTIADGQQTPSLGELTFPIIAAHVDEIVGVTDDEIVAAMRFAFERLKIVLEPSGASALAALLAGGIDLGAGTVAVVLSGGNVDSRRFAELVG